MAFLDFIKNRGQQSAEQQSQQQKPEISHDASRQATQERVAATPTEYVRPEQQGRLAEVQALYNKGTQEASQPIPAPSPAPEDGTTNPQPMRQAMSGQDKAAPDMSPTSAQHGSRAEEVEGPSAPTHTPSNRETIARPTPSWER